MSLWSTPAFFICTALAMPSLVSFSLATEGYFLLLPPSHPSAALARRFFSRSQVLDVTWAKRSAAFRCISRWPAMRRASSLYSGI